MPSRKLTYFIALEIGCNKGYTSYWKSSEGTTDLRDGSGRACGNGDPLSVHATSINDVKGSGLAIAYKDNFADVKPEDFVMFSIKTDSPWFMYACLVRALLLPVTKPSTAARTTSTSPMICPHVTLPQGLACARGSGFMLPMLVDSKVGPHNHTRLYGIINANYSASVYERVQMQGYRCQAYCEEARKAWLGPSLRWS